MEGAFFVYILASRRNSTLYVGMTSDLARRIHEHKEEVIPGFTRKYSVNLLIYYEQHEDAGAARAREKAMKKWRRAWKLQLIERDNPQWLDLSAEFLS